MPSLELNKILASFLFACLILSGVATLVDYVYAPPEAEQSGYIIAVDENESAGSGGDSNSKDGFSIDIAKLLVSADIERGKVIAKKCLSCHTLDKGGSHKNGPNLWGVLGSGKAAHDGFSYSKALVQLGGVWSYDDLALFLHKPKEYVKGTKMSFVGIRKEQDIADVILYLRTLHDSPPTLPEVKEE